jgi:hypothetical protein
MGIIIVSSSNSPIIAGTFFLHANVDVYISYALLMGFDACQLIFDDYFLKLASLIELSDSDPYFNNHEVKE